MSVNLGQLGSLLERFKNVSSAEMKMIDQMPPEARSLQMDALKLYKEQEAVNFISNLMKKMHESSMAIINNMR